MAMPLVHRGNLLGWLGPGRTRPALEDQAHPEPKGEALLAADVRGGFRMPARLLPVPPVLMEHRQTGERIGEGKGCASSSASLHASWLRRRAWSG